MFSRQDVTVDYILHKGKIHQVGPISGESRNFKSGKPTLSDTDLQENLILVWNMNGCLNLSE